MAVLALLALALFAVSAAPSDASRIVGGWPVSIEQYPGIVQVETRALTGAYIEWCAANILNTRYVLSAAHCFHGILYRPQNRRIRAGTNLALEGGIIVNVEREFNHPSYRLEDRQSYDGDISVVRLASPLEYSPVVQPVAIPQQGTEMPDGVPVQLLGWGLTSGTGSLADVLKETSVFTINRQLCTERYENERPVTENMICAGLLDVGGRDSCGGDSGGPMYYNDPSHGDILFGIISWGPTDCAHAYYPGVNTAVSSYTDWIVQTAV